MNIVPIAFAFDNAFVFPASVCIFSLLSSADKDTFYEIFIIHSSKVTLAHEPFEKLANLFANCRFQYRKVDDSFEKAFEVRGITVSTYYRLLIPEIIPEYDKILYSDVDVIFRDDLSSYYSVNLDGYYFAGVNSLADKIPDLNAYYLKLGLDSSSIFYAGNLVINSAKIRQDNVCSKFKELAMNKYKFQDLDVINVACQGGIQSLPPSYCLTTYIGEFACKNRQVLYSLWQDSEIEYALEKGIIHYNGQKPWKGYCPNFDIWWEYYRKSPFFDQQFYFDFFYDKLDELDRLPLWKRVKILARYFVFGKKGTND